MDGGPAVELTIYQSQAAVNGLFPMPIDIAITTAGGDTMVTIYNDEEYQTFTIPLTAAAVTLALDPDDWILKQVEFVALVDPNDGSIATFTLDQNYPNPFNALTRINYTVPTTAEMDLRIYDLLGREVAVLLNRTEHGGYHHVYWDGKDHFGRPVPSGIYFYRLEATDPVFTSQPVFIETRKIVLLR
ncbi:MAG: T9SS type A sorting domain-containing protein [Candidatus Marinimicrobia bacterium]|nr:T9SS type A sorting domain-containing protein [Candidatus Neomarinimicrobiota bacterium]